MKRETIEIEWPGRGTIHYQNITSENERDSSYRVLGIDSGEGIRPVHIKDQKSARAYLRGKRFDPKGKFSFQE